jgi:hypothetical protein
MNLKTGIYYKEIEPGQTRVFKLFTDPSRPDNRMYGQYRAKALTVLMHNRVNAIEIYYLIGEDKYLYLSERDKYLNADFNDLRNIVECIFEREHVEYRVDA